MSRTLWGENRPISLAKIPSILLGNGMVFASGYVTGAVLWIRADLLALSRATKGNVLLIMEGIVGLYILLLNLMVFENLFALKIALFAFILYEINVTFEFINYAFSFLENNK